MAKRVINPHELRVEIIRDTLVLSGSINATLPLEHDVNIVDLQLSDGSTIQFKYDPKHDGWFMATNRKDSKYFQTIPCNDREHSDIFVATFAVLNVRLVNNEGKDVYFGNPTLSKEQKDAHENIVTFLIHKGWTRAKENDIKRYLMLLIAGEHDKDWR